MTMDTTVFGERC